eukprot:GFYU01009551.1.p1 GENE.GFYU01009551.1~~GFYU01009551.1.p1  ORF type:complete len:455 (-),score=72.68 GFYU01009551.1:319-1683(-)
MARSWTLALPAIFFLQGTAFVAIALFPVFLTIVGITGFYLGLGKWYRKGRVDPNGKTVLVTGCDKPQGREVALRLDQKGFNVFAVCPTMTECNDMLSQSSDRLVAVQGDVLSEMSIESIVATVSEATKKNGLWALVNADQISCGLLAEVSRVSDFQDCLNVNTIGVIRITKACIPLLRKAKGRVVTLSSIAGSILSPTMSPYSTAAFATEGFMNGLRLELEPFGIHVAVVQPGMINSTLEQTAGNADKCMSGVPDNVKSVYGSSFVQSFKDLRIRSQRVASDAVLAMNALTHAVISTRPKQRYYVGSDVWFLWMWLAKLPDWLGMGCLEILAPQFGYIRDHWRSKVRVERDAKKAKAVARGFLRRKAKKHRSPRSKGSKGPAASPSSSAGSPPTRGDDVSSGKHGTGAGGSEGSGGGVSGSGSANAGDRHKPQHSPQKRARSRPGSPLAKATSA